MKVALRWVGRTKWNVKIKCEDANIQGFKGLYHFKSIDHKKVPICVNSKPFETNTM